jgi:sugar phosphate isomerase/epimerase
LPELLPVFREAGFRFLEVVDTESFAADAALLDRVRRQADACGVAIPNWHLWSGSPFQGKPEISAAAVLAVRQSMARGQRIGAQNHVVHWFHRQLDRRYDALWTEVVDELAGEARRLGVRLLMETVPDKPKNERYVESSEILSFVKKYPPEVLSICVDVNHSNLKENLPEVVTRLSERLVSLHVSDNDGNLERHWLPGRGVIDFAGLMKALADIRFRGYFVLEVAKWSDAHTTPPEIRQLCQLGQDLLGR